MPNELVSILQVENFEEWDIFVDQTINGTIFHKSYYLNSLSDHFVIISVRNKDGKLVAGLPVETRKVGGISNCAIAPRLTPYGGPIFKINSTKNYRINSDIKQNSKLLCGYLRENFHYVSLFFTPGMIDLQPFLWQGAEPKIKYTYKIGLEDITGAESQNQYRNDIRKAEKDGLTTQIGDNFDGIKHLVNLSYARQTKNINLKGIDNLYKELSKRGQAAIISVRDPQIHNPIAGAMLIWDSHCAYYLLGGYDHNKAHRGAGPMALWSAINYAATELKLREFDFEGSSRPNIEQYFRKFGGNLTPVLGIRYLAPLLCLPDSVRSLRRRLKLSGNKMS